MDLHPLVKAAVSVMDDIAFDDEVRSALDALLPVLPWDSLTETVKNLQVMEKASWAIDEAEPVLKPWLDATSGLAWLPVMCSAMYGTACRLQAAGVSKEILVDTFRALRRFSREDHRDFGAWGFDRQFWSWRQCCGCLLRIGTLEYEQRTVRPAETELFGLKEGDMVLSVHIPSDAHLSPDIMASSFRQACQFYQNFWHVTLPGSQAPRTIVCTTWLLSPELLPCLSESSGIRAFSNCFHLVRHIKENEDYITWLFGRSADKDHLPENTSLQRKVKQLMADGIHVGVGTGELKAPCNMLRNPVSKGE